MRNPQYDGEWTTSIVFDATDVTGEHNPDICNMLTNYWHQLSLSPYAGDPVEAMDRWLHKEGPRYRADTLMDREPKDLYSANHSDDQG